MFDTVKALWAGFSGELEATKEARKMVWLLLLTFLAGWISTAFAGWISFPSYRAAIAYLPGANYIALAFTTGIAGFLYFALAYLSGFFVERWRGTPETLRNYQKLGARIFGVAACLFLVVDVYMNLQGTTHRAKDAAGSVATFTYQTPEARQKEISSDRATLTQLQAGELGGYGWRNPQDGIYYLNNSGKRYQRELSGNIRRLQLADSTDRAASLADVEAHNVARTETEAMATEALKNAVYGVYVLVLILCIVQAYITEAIQEAAPHVFTVSVKTRPGKSAAPYAVAPRATTGGVTLNVPLDGIRQTHTAECANCGSEFHVRRKGHKYCSEPCRIEAWQRKTGKQLRKTKKQ